jgi:hypothetical protein
MRLAEGEEKTLDQYTSPVLEKCLLLLRIPPMSSVDRSTSAGAVPAEQRAEQVYRKMWQQSVGNNRVKRAIDSIADFVKSPLLPSAALAAQELRRSRARDKLAGFQTLLELVKLPECARSVRREGSRSSVGGKGFCGLRVFEPPEPTRTKRISRCLYFSLLLPPYHSSAILPAILLVLTSPHHYDPPFPPY